ncbi:MAG: hypothetical protein IPG58_16150 [Acidobacteria bacterium]|nr:hypothetical protein [Acidobacteriota bacterium]
MYRRPKFLEILLDIRREMAAEADHDVELFAEMAAPANVPSRVCEPYRVLPTNRSMARPPIAISGRYAVRLPRNRRPQCFVI